MFFNEAILRSLSQEKRILLGKALIVEDLQSLKDNFPANLFLEDLSNLIMIKTIDFRKLLVEAIQIIFPHVNLPSELPLKEAEDFIKYIHTIFRGDDGTLSELFKRQFIQSYYKTFETAFEIKYETNNLLHLSKTEKFTLAKLLLKNDQEGLIKFNKEKKIFQTELPTIFLPSDFYEDLLFDTVKILYSDRHINEQSKKSYIEYLYVALRNTPDNIMSVESKKKLIDQYYPDFPESKRIIYAESPPALQTQSKISTITPSQYKQAIGSTFDKSDYIILTLGLFKSVVKHNSNQELNTLFEKIERNYFDLDYDKCISDLDNCLPLVILADEDEVLSAEDIVFIRGSAVKCTEIDKQKNLSRRFYENRLSQYVLGSAYLTNNLETFNKLSACFKMDSVSTPDEIEQLLDTLAELDDNEALQRMYQLQKISPIYQRGDIATRWAYHQRNPDKEKAVYSMNFGAMPANAPNFLDFISKSTMANKVVDRREIVDKTGGYSKTDNRERSAFVASISGHAYFCVILCDNYLNSRKKELSARGLTPEDIGKILSKEINTIFFTYAAIFVKKGYHSFYEALDVFTEPLIASHFRYTYLVEIASSIDPKEFQKELQFALNDTLAYSKGNSLKKRVHEELEAKAQKKNQANIEALSIAAQNRDKAAIETLLKKNVIDINERNSNGFTALHEAVHQENNREIIELLLERGAQIDAKDKDGKTALDWAASEGKIEMVKLLRAKGAIDANMTAVHLARKNGHEAVVMLFRNTELLINYAKFGDINAVQTFIDEKVELDARNSLGFTALHEAIFQEQTEIVKLLLKNMDSVDVTETERGRTALHIAVEEGEQAIVRVLLESGANPYAKNKQGETPYDTANSAMKKIFDEFNKLRENNKKADSQKKELHEDVMKPAQEAAIFEKPPPLTFNKFGANDNQPEPQENVNEEVKPVYENPNESHTKNKT